MKLKVYTDGASRGNPGQAAYGFAVYDDKGPFYEEGKYIGITTNNVAEYQGLVEALRYVKKSFSANLPIELEVYTDSMLLAMQASGKYRIKAAHLMPFYVQVKELEKEIGKVSFHHVPRSKNILADKLANQALDDRRI